MAEFKEWVCREGEGMLNLRAKVNGWVMCVAWLGVATLITGCEEEKTTQAPAEVKPIEMLSVGGVGPINAQTAFNLHDITAAFPNLNVTQQTNFTEGQQYPVIMVSQDLKPLLTINPDLKHKKIFSVTVHDNLIGNQLGNKIGSRFGDVYKAGQLEECAPGSEEFAGKVLCYAPKTGNVLYLFRGDWNGPSNQVPPQDILSNWLLEAIVWKPPVKKP